MHADCGKGRNTQEKNAKHAKLNFNFAVLTIN